MLENTEGAIKNWQHRAHKTKANKQKKPKKTQHNTHRTQLYLYSD